MRSSYDLSRANALIDAYLVAIRDTAQIAGKHGRTWLEFMMKEHGVIPDVRNLAFGEAQAIWFAALIKTQRVNEVSRAEVANNHASHGRTTARTIRRILSNRWTAERDTHTARMVREIIK